MNEQQKIIFDGACRIFAGLVSANANKDVDRDRWNKYCIEKAAKLYNDTMSIVK